ncbi:MAG: zinc ABC transporter solute-binding protein [Burkholderiales bacterium]|nr:zinc ABC transporter solute-binding protein [Burkholderiales bacterium]
MSRFAIVFCAALACLVPSTSHAKIRAFACEPEWAALLDELGGKQVSIYQATSPKQDPHHVEARPSLIAQMRRADLLVCSGSDLEIGWLPELARAAANRKVQPGQAGYFMASEYVERLDVPEKVDRSMGDVHPYGNPHVHLDPRNLATIANALASRLAEIDSDNADFYSNRHAAFQKKWSEALKRWENEAAALRGLRLVTYHRDAVYLVNWLGLKLSTTIEPKPGIPPSAGHLSDLLSQLRENPADVIVRMAYNEPKAPKWLSERTAIPLVELPYTVGGTKRAKDLFGLFDDTIERLKSVSGR